MRVSVESVGKYQGARRMIIDLILLVQLLPRMRLR